MIHFVMFNQLNALLTPPFPSVYLLGGLVAVRCLAHTSKDVRSNAQAFPVLSMIPHFSKNWLFRLVSRHQRTPVTLHSSSLVSFLCLPSGFMLHLVKTLEV